MNPGQSTGEYFVWSMPERPVSVHLNLSTVTGLHAQSRDALGTLPRRGLEVGGMLLGRVKHPNPGQYIVSIDGFEPFEVEHVRGPSYILSAADRDELFQRLRKFEKAKKELSVVGFYRTHTRPGLYLDEYDFDLLKSYFAHPSSVVLLIRPAHDAPATAGFFIWEDGEVYRASTYREFPLDTGLLRSHHPVERPDASAPVVSPLPAAVSGGAPPIAGAAAVAAATAREPDAPVSSADVIPMPPAQASAAPSSARPLWLWTGTAAAVLMATTALWYSTNPLNKRGHNLLSLNAEPTESGLRLTWDRTSPLIAQHQAATLSITDGAQEKQLSLDTTQLKTGSLVYWPITGDVNFRLQLGGFTESLRAISPNLPAQRLTPAPETPAQNTPAPQTPAPETPAADNPPPQPPPKAQLARATAPRGEQPQTAASQVRPAVLPQKKPSIKSPVLSPPPPAELAVASARLDKPVLSTEPRVSRPPTFAEVEPVRGSGFKRVVGAIFGKPRDEDDFTPAKAIRKVNPSLPGSVALPADTRVSIKVNLDETGRIKGTDLMTRNADARLANAAMDAAKRWRFEPAKQQNKPVSSAVIVHFQFNHGGS